MTWLIFGSERMAARNGQLEWLCHLHVLYFSIQPGIEAHNIAVTALELRQGVMNEFALSVFALSHIDAIRDEQVEGRQ